MYLNKLGFSPQTWFFSKDCVYVLSYWWRDLAVIIVFISSYVLILKQLNFVPLQKNNVCMNVIISHIYFLISEYWRPSADSINEWLQIQLPIHTYISAVSIFRTSSTCIQRCRGWSTLSVTEWPIQALYQEATLIIYWFIVFILRPFHKIYTSR